MARFERPWSDPSRTAILFLLPIYVKDPIAILAHVMSTRILRFRQSRDLFLLSVALSPTCLLRGYVYLHAKLQLRVWWLT